MALGLVSQDMGSASLALSRTAESWRGPTTGQGPDGINQAGRAEEQCGADPFTTPQFLGYPPGSSSGILHSSWIQQRTFPDLRESRSESHMKNSQDDLRWKLDPARLAIVSGLDL